MFLVEAVIFCSPFERDLLLYTQSLLAVSCGKS
jgi:hypothetical protein